MDKPDLHGFLHGKGLMVYQIFGQAHLKEFSLTQRPQDHDTLESYYP